MAYTYILLCMNAQIQLTTRHYLTTCLQKYIYIYFRNPQPLNFPLLLLTATASFVSDIQHCIEYRFAFVVKHMSEHELMFAITYKLIEFNN